MVCGRNAAAQLPTLILACVLAIGQAFADPLSPKETYEKYRTTLAAANKIEDLQSAYCKSVNKEIDQTPGDMKPIMFQLMKGTAPANPKILSESIDGDKATLTLSAQTVATPAQSAPTGDKVSESTTGKVTLLKEDGTWKIEKESWESKIQVGGSSEK